MIDQHNSKKERSFDLGVNQLSTMTLDEFSQIYLTLNVPPSISKVKKPHNKPSAATPTRLLTYNSLNVSSSINGINVSASVLDVDWARDGFVSSVKGQGACGSCYAHSAIAALESVLMIQNNTPNLNIDLS